MDSVNDWMSKIQHKITWRSLVRKTEFQKVYEQGVKKVGRLVVVYLLMPGGVISGGPNGEPISKPADEMAHKPDFAWAVVASKKVGNAVARNRAKRLMREARRLGALGHPDEIAPIIERFLRESGGPCVVDTAAEGTAATADTSNRLAGLWVVLVARQRILSASSREVREELDALLREGPQPH